MRNFTYLGFNISLAGNIKDGLLDLHKRAQKAFNQLKNQPGDMFYREPLVLAIKLFDALVKPILLYCSDFWGCYDNIFSLSNSTERLKISLCKHLLGVKVQMKCFFIAEFERATKIKKIAVYRFLISLLVPEI